MNEIQAQLKPGERIVWQGQPEPLYVFAMFVARSLIWWPVVMACIIGPMYTSWWLFIPALPVFLFAGWRCDEARIAREKDNTTCYVVTNRRAVITQEKPRKSTLVYTPGEIEQVEFRNRRFGLTDVLFSHGYIGARFGPDAHVRVISTGFLRTIDRDNARTALETISNLEPRHRMEPGKFKIVRIRRAILDG